MKTVVTTVMIATAAYCPPSYIGPTPSPSDTTRGIIYELHPRVKSKVANHLHRLVTNLCDYRDWHDAIRIAYLESSFRFDAISETHDHGVFQLNTVHGPTDQWSVEHQTKFACRRIRVAKERGDLAYYHSKTPSKRRAYNFRLNKLKRSKHGNH